MLRNRSFALAALLVILGIVAFALQPVLDPKPDAECVAKGAPSSGFVDDDQDGCGISQESWDEISDWDSSPKMYRSVGLLLIVAGVFVAIVGLVRARRGDSTPRAG